MRIEPLRRYCEQSKFIRKNEVTGICLFAALRPPEKELKIITTMTADVRREKLTFGTAVWDSTKIKNRFLSVRIPNGTDRIGGFELPFAFTTTLINVS